MKKLLILLLTILILTLAACSSNASGSTNPISDAQTGSSPAELPAATRLIMGTFKLEDTNQAVTAKQAAELLPLWQTLKVLSDSDTAADQEKEALITQIQETMTFEQMQTITDMNLTRQDMRTIMQAQGITTGQGSQNNSSPNGNSSNNSGRTFGTGGDEFPGRGVPPEGGFPGGGSGFGEEGQSLSSDQIATAQAARQQTTENAVPTMFINALIEFLQRKAGS